MNIVKGKIDNKIMEIVKPEDLSKSVSMYDNQDVAVQINDTMALPLKNTPNVNSQMAGYYYDGSVVDGAYNIMANIVPPTEKNQEKYIMEQNSLINFDSSKSYADIIAERMKLNNMENELLTNPDNITHLNITEKDTPWMAGTKEAVNLKGVDLDDYRGKIPGWLNNKKIFYSNNISIAKMAEMLPKMGVRISMTLEDIPGCINPMGQPVEIKVAGFDE